MRDSMTSDAAPIPSPEVPEAHQGPQRLQGPQSPHGSLFRPAILSAVTALAIVLLALLVLRAWVWPQLDRWRDQVERLAGAALGREVRIEQLKGVWNGLAPALDIRGLRVQTPDGAVGLSAVSVRGVLSPAALWSRELRFSSLVIEGPVVRVSRQTDGVITLAGWRLEPSGGSDAPVLEWLLRQGRIRLDAGQIDVMDDTGSWPAGRRISVAARLEREAAGHQAYLDLGGIDLHGVTTQLPRWLKPQESLLPAAEGQIRLQVWSSLARGRGSRVVAQADVDGHKPRSASGRGGEAFRLDLHAMLALAPSERTQDGSAWQARIEQINLSDGQGLRLGGSGALHWSAGESGPTLEQTRARLDLAGIELQTLEPALRRLGSVIGRSLWPQDFRLAGRLEQLHLQSAALAAGQSSPEGRALTLEAQVSGLSLTLGQTSQERAPTGVSGLSGTIRWQPGSAQFALDAGPLELSLPRVWTEPILKLTRAQGEIALKSQPGKSPSAARHWTLESPQLRFATDDLSGTARVRWDSGAGVPSSPGRLKLSASIERVAAARIGRYLPVVVGPETRRWIARAVQTGSVEKIEALVQGDLAHFPFRDPAHGEFRISGRLREVGLDYAPGWPALQGLDGPMVFERGGFEIKAATARLNGVTLRDLKANLADYREGRLDIEGQGEGPAQALLDFIDRSPLSRTISTFTRDLKIDNSAALALALQIPLDHPEETRVRGEVTLNGNDLVLDRTLPPFQSVRGRVAFTDSELALREMSATFLGGPLTASTVPGRGAGDSLRIEANGRLEVSALQALLDNPLTQALAGSVPYRAEIEVDRRASSLRLRSDLTGLASSLPAPLNKRADETLAFEVRSRPLPVPSPQARPPGDRVDVLLGPGMHLALERRRDATTDRLKVQRAGFGMGVIPILRDQGLTVAMQTDQFDFDAWGALLARTDLEALQKSGGAQALPGLTLVPDWVSVVADTLRIGGQTLNEVVIGASRQEGYWRANVAAREISGHFEWLDARPGEPIGTLRARFDRLSLPRAREGEIEQALARPPERLPALEVTVESLELGRVPLGRLSLVAENAGTADRPVWSLRRLEVDNPHGRLSASGRWAYVAGPGTDQRSTELDLVLQVRDAGGLLGRFGIEHAVRAAPGEISGSLHWHGSPLAVDLPSLQGALQMSLGQGSFLRIDPGAARLVSVLNLQSLGRLFTGDLIEIFREGFAFDTIKGQVTIDQGVIRSGDLLMSGPQATVSLQGWADLRRETQDLQVRLVPEFNPNLASVAVGAMVNPAVGLGSLAAQYVLRKPLQQALAMEFEIDGSWADPQIRQRRGAGPALERSPEALPAPTLFSPGSRTP